MAWSGNTSQFVFFAFPCSLQTMGTSHNQRVQRTVLQRERFETAGQARRLTFSTFNRTPFLAPTWARDLFVDHLALTKGRLGFKLYG